MKKKNAAKMFLMSLLKSLICIVVILAVGIISYKISYSVLSKNRTNVATDSHGLKDIMEDATTDEISKNLIYVSDENNKITHIMLEICNSKSYNMDYVTIPVKTDYTIPSVMYRKLCQINQEIPQIIRLSELKQYFADENDAYGYGVLIFEKMLGTDISYYTALDQETYDNHYVSQKVKVEYVTKSDLNNTPGSDGVIPVTKTTLSTNMKISVASDAYKNQIRDLGDDQEEIASYIKDQYERVTSNLTVYNKIGYIETYQKMNVDYYHYWGIPCTLVENAFQVDTKAAKKALKTLIENDVTYSGVQNLNSVNSITSEGLGDDSDSTTKAPKAASMDLKIRVLNGSQIAGLASTTKQRLEEKGYTVPEVGNYTRETLTTTRIVVSQKGQGKDLMQYFNNPEYSVGTVADGYDIEIILGTADAN